MRLVPVDKLKSDSTIALDVMNAKNLLLIKAGTPVTDNIIEKLRSAKLQYIYINDEFCTEQMGVGCMITNDSESTTRMVRNFEDVIRHIGMGLGNSRDIDRIVFLCNSIVDEYYHADDEIRIVYEPSKIAMHSVTEQMLYISMMSVALGKKMGLPLPQLFEICMICLLRDFAYIAPKDSVALKDIENENELEEKHMLIAYRMLNTYSQINRNILDGIIHHHEVYDGSGFPAGLKGHNISRHARIVSIIDYFYQLKSNSEIMVAGNDILELVFLEHMDQFDADIVSAFLSSVELFTIDTMVKLTTGDIAVIEKNGSYSPFVPVVRIIRSRIFEKGRRLDLSTRLPFTPKIESVIYYMEDVPDPKENQPVGFSK